MRNKRLISKVLLAVLSISLISINSMDKAYASTTPQTWSFSYTGSFQTFTAPSNGTYLLETWGGQGGGTKGGNGGYSSGQINLNTGQKLYVYVGSKGNYVTGGWNGGGSGGANGANAYGGGGATDIRLNSQNLSDRIIVAGGGGGMSLTASSNSGGAGGGLTGLIGKGDYPGGSASQTSGGKGGIGTYGCSGTDGTLGIGGNGHWGSGGGGGGYYGGGGAGYANWSGLGSGGGGGSGYTGSLLKATITGGNLSITSPSGGTEVGHIGNGNAKITLLSNANIDDKTTIVIGTFNATTIDVSVPAVNSFTFNPNTNEFNVQDIQINNNSSAPVYTSIKQITVSPTSEWIPGLIAPTAYTDNGWNNLSQADTKSKVALGISAVSNSNWLNGITNQNVWSTDLTNGVKVGAIRTGSSVSVTPTLKVGRAITNEKTLTSNYVFEFGLE